MAGLFSAWKYKDYIKQNDPGLVVVQHPALADAAKAAKSKSRLMGINGVKSFEAGPDGRTTIRYDPKVLKSRELIDHGVNWLKWLESLQ